jgi:hypothetical protein
MTRGTTTPTETMTALIKPTCEGKGLRSRQTLRRHWWTCAACDLSVCRSWSDWNEFTVCRQTRAEDLANQLYTQHAVTSVHVS